MPGFVTNPYAGNLGSLHGKPLTFGLFTSTAEPTRSGGPIDALAGEVSTATAPGYARQTANGVWSNGQLSAAGGGPEFQALGATDIKYLVVADAGQMVAVLAYPVPVAGNHNFKPLLDGVIAAPVWYDGVEGVGPGDGTTVTGTPVVPIVNVDDTVIREGDNRLTNARTPLPHTHVAADISNSSTVGRNVLTASSQGAARLALGAASLGDNLFTAASPATGRSILGASTVGSSLFIAGSASSARTTLGASTVGSSVFTAANEAAARSAIGATTVGSSLFTAPDAAAARSTISAVKGEGASTLTIISLADYDDLTNPDPTTVYVITEE